jgi:alkanesulfonate monooxygenase SsuD/methylene tetrahydromethanopterin reductase-like flavin-dependent oxidoreductase (luciferase family)
VATLAVNFSPTQAPERLGAVAAAAEAAGLPELWVWEDCFCQSGIATATAILAATSHVRVGIGLLPVPLRNVALTAMETVTTHGRYVHLNGVALDWPPAVVPPILVGGIRRRQRDRPRR